MEFQAEKTVVLDHFDALGRGDGLAHPTPGYHWRGVHPFGEIRDAGAVAARFWDPLRAAFGGLTRRQDIFFAGLNQIGGFEAVWVCSMGHLMGLFDRPWLGIRPTGKLAFLRYAEFHRIADGRIAETAQFIDIPHLMAQAGQPLFPVQTAQHLIQPGPDGLGGLLTGPQPVADGRQTLALINAMIGDLGTWQLGLPLEEELARTWHDDMLWWGPEGIGATYTIPRYARQHSGPFRAAFSGRSTTRHLCRMAEGAFGGFFGWPNFTADLTGPYLGQAPTGRRAEFRVVDLYRRRGEKLAENWVFIDMLHFCRQAFPDFPVLPVELG